MLIMEDPVRYILHVQMRGIPDALQFPIDRQTGERLQTALDHHSQQPTSLRFFWFTSVDEIEVALSINDIEYVNFLWETGISFTMPLLGEMDDELTIGIFFRDRAKPLLRKAPDHEEIETIFHIIQEPLNDSYFLSFTDEDDEMVTFNPQHVVMITSKTEILQNEG